MTSRMALYIHGKAGKVPQWAIEPMGKMSSEPHLCMNEMGVFHGFGGKNGMFVNHGSMMGIWKTWIN
jgi:hypothetical protein